MAVSLNISIAEMLSQGVEYSTQSLRLQYPAQTGGRSVSNYGHDVSVLNAGVGYWSGSLSIAAGDRSSMLDTGKTESLLLRLQDHTKTFACPIIRNTDQMIEFRGTRASQQVTLDNDLFEDYFTATSVGSEASNGSVAISYSVNQKVNDATLSGLVAVIPQGCYLSIDGLLFMTTADNQSTALTGLLPNKQLSRLTSGSRIYWKNPWIVARIVPGYSTDLLRYGPSAGPWSINWEEAS